MVVGTDRTRLRLIGYLRVSTDRQAELGLGLVVQEKAVRAWARANGHRIVKVIRDEGISGAADVVDRPGLGEALAAVESGSADGVAMYRLDRLARSLTVQEAVLAQLWNLGGRVFTVDMREVLCDDPDDPTRTALRQIIGVFAQLERSLIAARMRAGRRAKAEGGGYAGFGSPPFGWRAEGKELVADEHEQATLARARELRDDGRSLRQIIEVLHDEGRLAKRGGRWHPRTLNAVLGRSEVVAK